MELQISKEKKELFVKSVIWKNLVSYFLDMKQQDISPYLTSIRITKQKKIIIKTTSSVIRNELYLYDTEIQEILAPLFKSVGIAIKDYVFVYK